jgi:hypothetical protein
VNFITPQVLIQINSASPLTALFFRVLDLQRKQQAPIQREIGDILYYNNSLYISSVQGKKENLHNIKNSHELTKESRLTLYQRVKKVKITA